MKRSMFKMATAIIASAAMLTSVAACGRTSATSDSADDVTTIDSAKATGDLTIWAMGNEGDLLGDFVKDFEKENTDVNCAPIVGRCLLGYRLRPRWTLSGIPPGCVHRVVSGVVWCSSG